MLTLFHSLLDNHLHGNLCQKSPCWGIANTATRRRRDPPTGQRRCFANCVLTVRKPHVIEALEAYFEREADTPEIVENTEKAEQRRNRWNR